MKKFAVNILLAICLYFAYKVILFSSVLLMNKLQLHDDIGKRGNNQYIIAGSSNVYFSYNYNILNSFGDKQFRSCWVPASYGLGLDLYRLNCISKPGDHIIFEAPYHWFLADQMAPHNFSFYSRANWDVFKFLLRQFPTDFFIHLAQYTLLNEEFYKYSYSQFKFKPDNRNADNVFDSTKFDSNYYSCDISKYKKNDHYVLCTEYQDFQFKKFETFLAHLQKEKQLEVHYSYPPLEQGNYKISDVLIQKLAAKAILPFDSCIWNKKYSFDMRYHLNYCGAEINSYRLYHILKK